MIKCYKLVIPDNDTNYENSKLNSNPEEKNNKDELKDGDDRDKTEDFRTVQEMINGLTQRLSDAFLVLNVRKSERTTATEVQATVQETIRWYLW
jgi:hypothetical protein